MGEVYKITNIINKKCYIGITKYNFRKRYNYRDDWWNAPSVCSALFSAVKKYGSENFTVEILEKCPKEMLEEKEKYYIKYYNSYGSGGYNLTSGGFYNYEISEESKRKNSETNKKRYQNGATSWNKGKKLSKAHIERTKETKKKLYKEGKISPWNKGKKIGKMKPEHIKKSAEAHKKPVVCINKNTKAVVKIYDGASDAKVDGFNPATICRCCKGHLKSHGGYIWKYKM